MNEHVSVIDRLAHDLRVPASELLNKIDQIQEQVKEQEKNIQQLKSKIASSESNNLSKKAISVGDIKVVIEKLVAYDATALKETIDKLKLELKSAVVILSCVDQGRVTLGVGVTQDLMTKIKAGEIASELAIAIGGKGGGKPDLALAGGSKPELLDQAFKDILIKIKKIILK
jgi:alanyl-tRNA synthetase